MSFEKNKMQRKQILDGMLKSFLTSLPILIAFAVIAVSDHPSNMIFSLSAFIAGFSGVIIIFRKEVPSSFASIRGMPALIIGSVVTLLCWSISIVILFEQ